MSKALFFDIDGTLVSFRTHLIPQSAVDAIAKAKALGHKIVIATGRPKCIINNLGQIEHLIDGYVTTNGAFCFAGDNIVRQLAFQERDTSIILQDARRKHYPTIVVNHDRLRVINHNELVERIFIKQLNIKNLDFTTPVDYILRQPVMQITSFIGHIREQRLAYRLNHTTVGRWHNAFVDFTPKGANKGNGILAMADFFGIRREDTVAFGDGGNDIPMLRTAGIGVAMGNAGELTRQAADYITKDIDEDGIANALISLNLC